MPHILHRNLLPEKQIKNRNKIKLYKSPPPLFMQYIVHACIFNCSLPFYKVIPSCNISGLLLGMATVEGDPIIVIIYYLSASEIWSDISGATFGERGLIKNCKSSYHMITNMRVPVLYIIMFTYRF